jgi:hypothetical protein
MMKPAVYTSAAAKAAATAAEAAPPAATTAPPRVALINGERQHGCAQRA